MCIWFSFKYGLKSKLAENIESFVTTYKKTSILVVHGSKMAQNSGNDGANRKKSRIFVVRGGGLREKWLVASYLVAFLGKTSLDRDMLPRWHRRRNEVSPAAEDQALRRARWNGSLALDFCHEIGCPF
ncbi:MAG: hypothetical protein MJY72_02345 [Bacteroidales bacterium]|nr:hypothetical protein [Bacteroidales bacterium]